MTEPFVLGCAGTTPGEPVRIGVISDTHGHLDRRVLDEFAGVSLIIHAGDVGHGVLEELGAVAPVMAVEGNTDRFPPGHLGQVEHFSFCGTVFYLKHDTRLGDSEIPAGVDVVVTGHTHREEVCRMGDTLLVNPGSISRSRRSDGVGTAALVTVGAQGPSADILYFP